LRQIFGKAEREEASQWFATHGGNIAQSAREAAVPHYGSRVPGTAEMHVLKAEVSCDQHFEARRDTKNSAIVPDTMNNCPVRERGRDLPDMLNQTSFFDHG
jgi:hypothetical protein